MARKPKSPAELASAAIHQLESLRRSGVTHLPRPKPGRRPTAAPAGETSGAAPEVATSGPPPKTPPAEVAGGRLVQKAVPAPPAPEATGQPGRSAQERASALAALARRVSKCTRCSELAATRTQTVFGSGDPQARLVFMGEAPGADEDREGFPFVGRAGQLLTKIIEACGFTRDQVYILNTLKCRPPGNRTPLPEEAANCREYLDGQLAILRPEFVCCLGAVAAQNLLGTDRPIGRLRGTVHELDGIRVVCTYHPAYLLRNPAAKRDTWDDMKFLLAAMGLQLPGGAR